MTKDDRFNKAVEEHLRFSSTAKLVAIVAVAAIVFLCVTMCHAETDAEVTKLLEDLVASSK